MKLKLSVDAWFTDGAQCTPRHTVCRNLKERKNLRNLEADGKNRGPVAMKHQIPIHSLLNEAFCVMDVTHRTRTRTRTRHRERLKRGKMMGNYINAAQFPAVGSHI